MRRALARGAAALLIACSAAAQDHPAIAGQAGAPDVPAGDAAIEGRVVDEQSRSGVPDLGVILYSLQPDGEPGLRQTRTDAEGAFRFDGISGDPEVVYLVGTRVGGVPFGARAVFADGETVQQVEVAVNQPSRDVGSVQAGEPRLRLERGCSHLRVHHEQPLTNSSSRVVYVPPDDREGAEPLFELELPEQATAIETPLGSASDGFERDGRRLRYFGPVYPGTTSVEFSYGIPLAREESLSIGFPDGAETVHILVPQAGAQIRGEGLREEGEIALPEGAQRSLRSDAIAPGGELRFEVALDEPGDESPVELSEVRIWLEKDDAALDVSESYELLVEGDAPVKSDGGAPLLCIPLPPAAESLRFSNASLAMGLSRDPEGALALSGPIPAGESDLSLRYRLPAKPGPVTFERHFQRDVDLLTLLVADTGIVADTQRLHRRRPVRTEDRSYLHLEGFGIERGEPVEVTLRPLPQHQGLPTLATSGILLLVAVGALFYLIAPLRSAAATGPEAPATGPVEEAASTRLAREREALYANIDDLDEDFETGKLSAEDHERMRAELRARAVALLQAERQPAAEPERAPAARFCTACGAKASEGDRFCSQCGTALRTDGSPGGSPTS
jgi:hypothetical protein